MADNTDLRLCAQTARVELIIRTKVGRWLPTIVKIADELTGNWRPEHLFNLRQALKMYDQLSAVIDDYDREILSCIAELIPDDSDNTPLPPHRSKSKARSSASL